MRIGLFTDTYLPDINGVATAVDTLARELRQLGHEVFVVTTNLARHSRIEREGNLIRIPGIVLKSLYSYRVSSPISPRNFDVLKDVPLDLIHIHTEYGIGYFGRILAWIRDIPLVYTYHSMYKDFTYLISHGNRVVDAAVGKFFSVFSRRWAEAPAEFTTPSEKIRDTGRFQYPEGEKYPYGDYHPACWYYLQYGGSHGMEDMAHAIKDSCNIYFFTLGDRLGGWYRGVLGFFVRHLWVGMGVSVAMVVLFAAACLNTRMVLMPEMDQGMVSVSISTPIGSEVEETSAYADRVVAIAQEEIPELESLYYIAQAESASVTLNLVGRTERDRSSGEVADSLRPLLQDLAGCEITVNAMDMTAMLGGYSAEVYVENQICIAQVLIVGQVPQTYVQ